MKKSTDNGKLYVINFFTTNLNQQVREGLWILRELWGKLGSKIGRVKNLHMNTSNLHNCCVILCYCLENMSAHVHFVRLYPYWYCLGARNEDSCFFCCKIMCCALLIFLQLAAKSEQPLGRQSYWSTRSSNNSGASVKWTWWVFVILLMSYFVKCITLYPYIHLTLYKSCSIFNFHITLIPNRFLNQVTNLLSQILASKSIPLLQFVIQNHFLNNIYSALEV